MITFAHMADTHLGAGRATGRVDEIIESFNYAFTEANEDDEVQFILIAGDVFDKVSPPWHVVTKFIRIMRTALKPVYIIAGNHDTSRIRIGGSLWEILEAIPTDFVHYVHGFESKVFDLLDGEARLVATPWGAIQEEKDKEYRRELDHGHRPVIWMTHGISDGVQGSHSAFLNPIITEFEMAPYTYVALGDLHTENQVQANAWYSGSTDRMNWSDYEAKPHWLKVTILEGDELNIEDRPIPVRDMFKLPAIAGSSQSAFHVINLLEEYIKDPETMYSVDIIELDYRERKEVRDRFKDFPFVKITFQNRPTSEEYEFEEDESKFKQPSIEELFESFLQHRSANGAHPPGFTDKFRKYGLAALEQAKETEEE